MYNAFVERQAVSIPLFSCFLLPPFGSRQPETLLLLFLALKGSFKCYVTLFFCKLDPHPSPRNANNIEHYTFVTLFSGKSDTPHPHLRYVTLEWPLISSWLLIFLLLFGVSRISKYIFFSEPHFQSLKPGTHHAIFVFCWMQRRRKDENRMVWAHQRRSSFVDFTNATVVGHIFVTHSWHQ